MRNARTIACLGTNCEEQLNKSNKTMSISASPHELPLLLVTTTLETRQDLLAIGIGVASDFALLPYLLESCEFCIDKTRKMLSAF